jgi:acyl-CoA synthetase (AMP-forming)/AMP-acid ligase II/acyl carrier protein
MSTRASFSPARPPTLVDVLRWRALAHPNRHAGTFLRDGETDEVRLTYGELDRHARAIGALLQGLEAAGERALLLYPPGLDYVAAYFGCLYAGVVAVPAYPPRRNRSLARLQAIVADARATLVLTTTPLLGALRAPAAEPTGLDTLRWLTTDRLEHGREDRWEEPRLGPDTLAFLQYTSGSTGAPRGVMVSHGNLLHNAKLIRRSFDQTPESHAIIWLPPYHDMGLIGGILQPICTGFPFTLMAPVDFLQRPRRWLQAISRYRATTSGGPNFAYDLCVSKIGPEEREGLDLSSWECAFNGAEPIRPDTLDRFATAFAPHGFRRNAFLPCYGLAEATLLVAGGGKAAPPVVRAFPSAALTRHRVATPRPAGEDTHRLVGCHVVRSDQELAIVRPESGSPCAPDEVGEIWVGGPSVARGYWNRPEETARVFQARLADRDAGPFLRTGDLGFVQDGELFVTGRLKDLIILRGRNYYPQDLEQTVEGCHASLRPGCGAAFSVEVDGEERLVIVQEVEREYRRADLNEVIATIRQAVARAHEVPVHDVVLIRPAGIPKTSSGKIQRRACRDAYLAGRLAVVAESGAGRQGAGAMPGGTRGEEPSPGDDERDRVAVDAPTGARVASGSRTLESVTTWLAARVSRELGTEPATIPVGQPFASFGLDSLKSVQLADDLATWLGRDLTPTLAWDYPTIEALAHHLASATNGGDR